MFNEVKEHLIFGILIHLLEIKCIYIQELKLQCFYLDLFSILLLTPFLEGGMGFIRLRIAIILGAFFFGL
jgi:hypothetical protein